MKNLDLDIVINTLVLSENYTGLVDVKQEIIQFTAIGMANEEFFDGKIKVRVGCVAVVN